MHMLAVSLFGAVITSPPPPSPSSSSSSFSRMRNTRGFRTCAHLLRLLCVYDMPSNRDAAAKPFSPVPDIRHPPESVLTNYVPRTPRKCSRSRLRRDCHLLRGVVRSPTRLPKTILTQSRVGARTTLIWPATALIIANGTRSVTSSGLVPMR